MLVSFLHARNLNNICKIRITLIVPDKFKPFYWAALIISGLLIIIARAKEITSGNSNAIDILIISVEIALLIVPIFSEMSFFGFGFKGAINDLRNDLKNDYLNLRNEIQTNLNIPLTVNVGRENAPNDSEIQRIDEALARMAEVIQGREIIVEREDYQLFTSSENDAYLFKVRLEIEKELQRITEILFPTMRRRESAGSMLNRLLKSEIFYPNMIPAIKDILSIGNMGVHGEAVTPRQLEFVKKWYPNIIDLLRNYNPSPPS